MKAGLRYTLLTLPGVVVLVGGYAMHQALSSSAEEEQWIPTVHAYITNDHDFMDFKDRRAQDLIAEGDYKAATDAYVDAKTLANETLAWLRARPPPADANGYAEAAERYLQAAELYYWAAEYCTAGQANGHYAYPHCQNMKPYRDTMEDHWENVVALYTQAIGRAA